MLAIRPTFSESWYRVADLRVKLRAGAQTAGSADPSDERSSSPSALARGEERVTLPRVGAPEQATPEDEGPYLNRPAR